MKVKRALLSVSDKTGLPELGKGLAELGIELISTGGTAKALRETGLKVREVSELTGSPEMLDGRVKTLHPKIHAGLLALRENKEHMRQVKEKGIELIDLVVINLYPFRETIAKKVSLEEAIENIDIGGPTMLRAAAKNYKGVAVVVDPEDYEKVLKEIKEKEEVSEETKARLAVKVFRHTADYDAAIDKYLSKELAGEEILRLKFVEGEKLRYGENWHQKATFFKTENVEESCIAKAKQLHGKEMSFNNYLDGDASFEVVKEFKDKIAVSVIKHTNPCGLATGKTLRKALEYAWQGDTVSAFGSVISCTRKVDLETAEFLQDKFVEAVIAPCFEENALNFLKQKSKNIRLLEVPKLGEPTEKICYRHIIGGMLEQSRDMESFKEWKTVTKTGFPEEKKGLAEFTWLASKHTKSNAIVLGYEYEKEQYMVLGMGAGQPNRVDSLRKLAVPKAEENLGLMKKERDELGKAVLASDAFFPFDDSVREAAKYGVKFIVQPGGSVKDAEVIKACDELGIAMVFTGMRHFRH